ncbi:MAG: KH domain-containing protein [Clostridia bacterium]|nr:KH domain-containing protein [Clostridia bacterium]
MKETLIGIAQSIVDNPEAVVVTQEEDFDLITLTLSVDPEDMGMVIGRHGRIAKAIRTLIKAAAAGSGKRVNVDIR